MAATEICVALLKADATIEDAGSDAGKRWGELVKALKQTAGVQKTYCGRKLEEPSHLVLGVVWSNIAAHHAFMASEAYGPFMQGMGALVNGATLHHLGLDASPALGAPTTEIFTAYGVEPGYAANLDRFAEQVDAARPAGCHGQVHGAVIEEITKDAAGAGAKGPAAQLLIGWDSKDAHLAAKAKPGVITENLKLLTVLNKDMDMFHVSFKEL